MTNAHRSELYTNRDKKAKFFLFHLFHFPFINFRNEWNLEFK